MITKEQFKEKGIAVTSDLLGNAALEWLAENTTLTVNLNDIATVDALPFAAKLFVEKYNEIISASSVVASESIEGLSQSFRSDKKTDMLRDIAEQLLSGYLKGRVKFITAQPRWR